MDDVRYDGGDEGLGARAIGGVLVAVALLIALGLLARWWFLGWG